MWHSRLTTLAGLLLISGLLGCANQAVETTKVQKTTTNALQDAKKPPKTVFFPRVEAGGHWSTIRRIGLKHPGTLLTVSDDKTARLWDMRAGELKTTLRPPIHFFDEGKLYAGALHPTQPLAIVSGNTGKHWHNSHQIYLFDTNNGELIDQFGNLPSVIQHLSISHNGQRLVVSLGNGHGIQVYNLADKSLAFSDTDYTQGSYWAEFSTTGQLVTTSEDGKIRLYNRNGQKIATTKPLPGNTPYSARFSPNGQLIAVGFDYNAHVQVLNAHDLSPAYTANTQDIGQGNLASVAWSQDGQSLYAGGSYENANGENLIRHWPQAGQGAPQDFPATLNSITSLQTHTDGSIIYAASDPGFGTLNPQGQKTLDRTSWQLDLRSQHTSRLRATANGSTIAFAHGEGHGYFSIPNRALKLAPQIIEPNNPLLQASKQPGDDNVLRFDNWQNTNQPRLNGLRLPIAKHDIARSISITPNNQYFVLGSEWHLYLFNAFGEPQWQRPLPAPAWQTHISRDGSILIAALGDGSIRWYALASGAPLASLFPHPSGYWVLWTPHGFFDALPGGEHLIGYHLNRQAGEAGEFISMDQMYDLFHRPDLVANVLSDAGQTRLAKTAEQYGDLRKILAGGLPPQLHIIGNTKTSTNSSEYPIEVAVQTRSGGVGSVVYRVNGVVRKRGRSTRGINKITESLQLAPGDNEIDVRIFNANEQIESAAAKLNVNVTQNTRIKPDLHVLAVGINDYAIDSLDLKFARNDAESIANLFDNADFFNNTHIHTLLDGDATLSNITQQLRALKTQVKPSDFFILYFAGHGKTLAGRYHFIPASLSNLSQTALEDETLRQITLERLLSKIPAQNSLILLDTCEAGSFLETLGNTNRFYRNTGRAVLAASTANQLAQEGYANQGVFTYTLYKGLEGAADSNIDGQVSLNELRDFTHTHVPQITQTCWNVAQTPVSRIPGQPLTIANNQSGAISVSINPNFCNMP